MGTVLWIMFALFLAHEECSNDACWFNYDQKVVEHYDTKEECAAAAKAVMENDTETVQQLSCEPWSMGFLRNDRLVFVEDGYPVDNPDEVDEPLEVFPEEWTGLIVLTSDDTRGLQLKFSGDKFSSGRECQDWIEQTMDTYEDLLDNYTIYTVRCFKAFVLTEDDMPTGYFDKLGKYHQEQWLGSSYPEGLGFPSYTPVGPLGVRPGVCIKSCEDDQDEDEEEPEGPFWQAIIGFTNPGATSTSRYYGAMRGNAVDCQKDAVEAVKTIMAYGRKVQFASCAFFHDLFLGDRAIGWFNANGEYQLIGGYDKDEDEEETPKFENCKGDCLGHVRGWTWARERGLKNPYQCRNIKSASFREGCEAWGKWAIENGGSNGEEKEK